MNVSDETLMAYADGELAVDEARAIEQHVANNPDAARRLAVFKGTGKTLGTLFNAPMTTELPERLVKAARGDDQHHPSNVVPLRRSKPSVFARPGLAMAASLALFVGAGGLYLLSQPQKLQGAGVDVATLFDQSGIARDGFKLALENASGNTETKVTGIANETAMKPELTFASKSGQFCRQYVVHQNNSALTGVACRSDDGAWRAEINVPVALKRAESTDEIVPAGRETPAEIDKHVDIIIWGDVLGQSDEASLIKNGWRKAGGN